VIGAQILPEFSQHYDWQVKDVVPEQVGGLYFGVEKLLIQADQLQRGEHVGR